MNRTQMNRWSPLETQLSLPHSRRAFLGRGAGLLAAASLPGVLAACGGDEGAGTTSAAAIARPTPEQVNGTIKMINFPDWIGPDTVEKFSQRYPGAGVRQITGLTSGDAQTVAQISQNEGAYDLSMATSSLAGQLEDAGLVQRINTENVPNLKRVEAKFREDFPWGMPNDFGRVGYGYRSDLIPEKPTTWQDFWDLSVKYSGKVTAIKFDTDVIGAALKYIGASANTTDEAELEEAKQALIELKPNVRAFLETGWSRPLLEGEAVLAMDYDFDIAAAQRRDLNIVWVAPEDGVSGYLEGWVALNTSSNLPTVLAFMDFQLEPQIYAGFVNYTGASFVMPDARPYIDPAILKSPALNYGKEELDQVEFTKYLGPEQTALRAKVWQEVLAS
jgi:spermidine/putrescine-binding protein